jgi:hypothetical protein
MRRFFMIIRGFKHVNVCRWRVEESCEEGERVCGSEIEDGCHPVPSTLSISIKEMFCLMIHNICRCYIRLEVLLVHV